MPNQHKTIEVACLFCQEPFRAREADIRRAEAGKRRMPQFCSRRCTNKARMGNAQAHPKAPQAHPFLAG